MGRIAIIGGTGPEGLGLALRFALSGEEVRIGSRDAARARTTAAEGNTRLAAVGCERRLAGDENLSILDGADLIVLAVPYNGLGALLPQLAPHIEGKLVLDVVNPLERVKGLFCMARVQHGSAAEEIQSTLPEVQVVSAFKSESAEHLNDLSQPLSGDVLVCSNYADARNRVLALIGKVSHVRPVDAGVLVNARSLEALTPLLLNLNKLHRAITSIQILGLSS